jgi:transcriptional regulator with XRE-family HTH domain
MSDIDLARRFAENVVRARKQAGLSQEQLGARAELHRTEIGIIERPGRLVRLDTLVKLAGALEVSPCTLLEGLAWRAAEPSRGRFDLGSPSN